MQAMHDLESRALTAPRRARDPGGMRSSVTAIVASTLLLACHPARPPAAPMVDEPAPPVAAVCADDRPAPIEGDAHAQIWATYRGVRRVIRNEDWCRLPALVDAETLRVYEVLRQWALRMPREELMLQPHEQRLLVLEMRLRFGPRLRTMTATELLAAGMVLVTGDILDIELAEVRIDAPVAYALVERDGSAMRGYRYRFVLEHDRWKLDLASVIESSDATRGADLAEASVARWTKFRGPSGEAAWQPIGD
jgi:hypothetical protein